MTEQEARMLALLCASLNTSRSAPVQVVIDRANVFKEYIINGKEPSNG